MLVETVKIRIVARNQCQLKLLDKHSCTEYVMRLRNNLPFVDFVNVLEKSDITWGAKVIAISAIHAIAHFPPLYPSVV